MEEFDLLKPFKFINEFRIADHQFQIKTELREKQIEATVTEEGKLLYQKWYPVNSGFLADEDELWNERAREAHEQVIEEIETLFTIKERIKEVTQAVYHYRFGRVLFAFNLLDEAKEEFQFAIDLRADFIKAYRKLAACYLKERNYRQAADTLKKTLETTEPFPDLLNDLGVAYTLSGEYRRAKDCFSQALEKKPDFQEANFNLGILLLLSSYEADSDHKVALPVRVIRSLHSLKGASYLRNSGWKEKIETLLGKIEKKKYEGLLPELLDLQFQLATREDPIAVKFDFFFLKFMYGKMKMDVESIRFYENWLSENIQNFKYADYWNDMGVIHLIQCRNYFLNALEEIEKAHQLNPNFEEAAENLEKIKRIKNGFLILLRALLKK
ncbi:Tetratricopeptide TPR_1 repeat-containing protein [Caldithrix abyssi DSM 13497]|uniref:Tetratricopeptide TPR_1 repeat-containing protein n=1 Tax=Caldithrix abyssi DSM 13497 TaxID=880073 RepID=H1XUI0_CALAY|nr:Tetratricopeptide TPR_1 repeat-containing protein [Caldithrix abyssi DSM 13497]